MPQFSTKQMNDQIKHLAQIADPVNWRARWFTGEDGRLDPHTHILLKLVIQECAAAVLDVPVYTIDNRRALEEATISDCSRAVLLHFGIDDDTN